MAARGLLTPFHVHTKLTPSRPPLLIPTFLSCLGKAAAPFRRIRFFCSHSEVGMSHYKDMFDQRMAMAGLKPHHRIAMAVSGGPDSIALCVLTAGWKSDNCGAATNGRSKPIDDLLAIVVDHGLRTESAEEAHLVYNRVTDMGIKCEVVRCEWLNGRPKAGHLQEAARNKRYETLHNVCVQQHIDILLVAHHSDDQEELFILRLSRNSGVLGLAGMAFVSQLFREFPDFSRGGLQAPGILLVRPLLDFLKQDMYSICQLSNQQWVEDPTNRSPKYARNRIRMSLCSLSSSIFKAELQAVISACRKTRLHVDKVCHLMFKQAVTIQPHGYAEIDLGALQAKDIMDIYLTKFAALVLRFISQRHRPVRGSASKLLLNYFRTYPCKTCLTVAGCYLCPAPGSKGTKVLVCCSVDSSLPPMMKMFPSFLYGEQNSCDTKELEQIVADSEAYMDQYIPNASSVPFLDVTSSDSILQEAKRIGMLSESTHRCIVSLQKEEHENFMSKPENTSDIVSKDDLQSPGATLSKFIHPGQAGYFMNRFVLEWKQQEAVPCNTSCMDDSESMKAMVAEGKCCCNSCIMINGELMAEVRHMTDADWIYLSKLSQKVTSVECRQQKHISANTIDYAVLSACKALVPLKYIPAAARRAIPVLVNTEGVLLSIPSIGFACCPCVKVSAVFKPRIPLGEGHSSFL